MKIARDKWKHFFVGIVMGIFLQVLFSHFLNSIAKTALLSFVASFAIAYGFELFSKLTGKGHYEWMDAVAGTIGAVVGIAIVLLIHYVL